MYKKVWQEINYNALTDYLNKVKSKVSITKTISYWASKPGETTAANYHSYTGKLLNKIADELKAKVNEEVTVLIIPARFLPILLFSPLEVAEGQDICGPYFAGVLCHSASVIVDPTCFNEFYIYNINEPEKVLKLEIEK